jgi:predicted KAP-like P-loop ATPase
VFVDDLDRCIPATIIDTLEAIRLFLHGRETAYVKSAGGASY